MTSDSQISLLLYKDIAEINAEHGIFLVQHRTNGKIFVKKVLTVFDLHVYRYLMEHPVKDTPHIYEVIEDDDKLIVIEEYISGRTLQELLSEQNILSEIQVLDYSMQLCSILESFHRCSPPIIHRDIKPSNVLLTPDGTIKLLDFNAAKLSDRTKERDTRLIGTQGYAAPEQYGFGASNTQTDIFALGMMMNMLLTGSLSRENIADSALAPIIRKCIMLNPSDRYDTVSDIKDDLSSLMMVGTNKNYHLARRMWLPPGFRQKEPTHMIIAIIGYLVILWAGITISGDIPGIWRVVDAVVFIFFLLSVTFFSANYGNIQEKFPLCNSRLPWLRIIGIGLVDLIIIFLMLLLLVAVDRLFL